MYWLGGYFTRTQVWILISTYITHHFVSACDSGWFGSLCQFQCHCQFDVCNSLGECVDDRCADGYFGPSCQYVDLVFNFKTDDTSQYLFDDDPDTCNERLISERVDIRLTRAHRFSWVRIVARVSVREYDFELLLDDSEDLCRFERDYFVDNVTVDVTCDATPLITHLAVIGHFAAEVCSIYISGGRDIALKQMANQTSTLGPRTADKALDGMTEDQDPRSSCSATNPGVNSEWVVLFNRPQLCFRVLIYGSMDPKSKLVSLDIFTLSEARIKINTILGVTCVNNTCDANLESPEPSVALVIRGRKSDSLALCTVQVFGETMCPEQTYGLECDQRCQCSSSSEICSLVTGECTSGCPGYYGYLCDKPCGVSCVNARCGHRSGDCLQCQPGHYGRLCSNECPEGKFGAGCLYDCSYKCLDRKCNRVNGACLKCLPARSGAFCNEIDEVDYGVWPYVSVVLGGSLLFVCCFCLRRTRIQQNDALVKTASVVTEPQPPETVPEVPSAEIGTAV